MPNLATRLMLFASSYSPLFLILAIRGDFYSSWPPMILCGVALLAVLSLFGFFGFARRLSPQEVVAAEVSSKDTEAMSYIVTYLVPFLDTDFHAAKNVAALALLFAVLAILYVNSGMLHINPVLNLAGYHIFEIRDDSGKSSALICKRRYLRRGSTLRVVMLDEYVMVEKEKATNG